MKVVRQCETRWKLLETYTISVQSDELCYSHSDEMDAIGVAEMRSKDGFSEADPKGGRHKEQVFVASHACNVQVG